MSWFYLYKIEILHSILTSRNPVSCASVNCIASQVMEMLDLFQSGSGLKLRVIALFFLNV